MHYITFYHQAAALARDAAQRRSLEAAEALEAQQTAQDAAADNDLDDAEGADGQKKGRKVNVGIEKTKLEGFVNVVHQKFTSAILDIAQEHAEISKRFDEHYKGGAVPAGVEQMKGELTLSLAEAKAEIEYTLSSRFQPWKTACTGATTLQAIKNCSQQGVPLQKDMKGTNMKAFYSLIGRQKKFLTNDARSKRNQSRAAGAEVGNATPASPGWVVANAVLQSGDINVGASMYEAKAGVRVSTFVSKPGKDIVNGLRQNAAYKKVKKDLEKHMEKTGQSWSNKATQQAEPNGKKWLKLVKQSLDSNLFTSLVLPDQPWAKNIYAYDVVCSKDKHVASSFTQFASCEARVYLEGSEFLIGVPYEKLPGLDLKEKRRWLGQASVDDLKHAVELGGGFAKWCKSDDCILIPSGFVLVAASQGCTMMRWAVGSDPQDSSRVRSMIGVLLQSYSELRAPQFPYSSFYDFLSQQQGC